MTLRLMSPQAARVEPRLRTMVPITSLRSAPWGCHASASGGSWPSGSHRPDDWRDHPERRTAGLELAAGAAQTQHHLPAAHFVRLAQFSVTLLIAAGISAAERSASHRSEPVIAAAPCRQRLLQMLAVELALLLLRREFGSVRRPPLHTESLLTFSQLELMTWNVACGKRLPIQSPLGLPSGRDD